jgi:exodeoxyribonuclease VII large subunit
LTRRSRDASFIRANRSSDLPEALANVAEFTVSELSYSIRRAVEDGFAHVRVRGEISGYRGPHSSGHAYFSLKDEGAKIEAVVWRTVFSKLRFKPEEGLEVIATGRVTTFPGGSKYQIVIEALEPAGVGALMALLEERRKTLAAEGLFDAARKRPLPFLPRVIGVVTSPTGAVIRDILHRLADRFPVRVIVWPVRVQGETSAREVAAAIEGFNAIGPDDARGIARPDVIIVARGGGSLEDLWSFNEEIVVRAAAASRIPLVAAVGHETDWTLIDYAADLRAPTPTGAAEMVMPVRADLIERTATLGLRLAGAVRRGMDGRRTDLRSAARALPSAEGILGAGRQTLDLVFGRLAKALIQGTRQHATRFARASARLGPSILDRALTVGRERLEGCVRRGERAFAVASERRRGLIARAAGRLSPRGLESRIERGGERLVAADRRLGAALRLVVERRRARLDGLAQLAAALSYQGVLARGFALVRDANGRPVRLAAMVAPDDRLTLQFSDGRVGATADRDPSLPRPPSSPENPPSAPRGRKLPAAGQGSLF